MAKQSFDFYKNMIKVGELPAKVIQQSREDYNLAPDFSAEPFKFSGESIPFNIEREYVIQLVEEKKYREARNFLENMRKTYRDWEYLNFIEIFEYHLHAAIHADENIKRAIEEAKKEFNNHTITIVSVVVGVITLLGAANQAFRVDNFEQGINTFFSITLAVLAVIITTFVLNNKFNKK